MTDDRKNANGSKEDRQVTRLKLYQKMVSDIRFTIPLLITLFGGTVYGNADTIKKLWSPPVAEGETVSSAETPAALQLSLDSFDAAIKSHAAQLRVLRQNLEAASSTARQESSAADEQQNARLDELEAKVQ